MLTSAATSTPAQALIQGWLSLARQFAPANDRDGIRRLKVYLDCETWLEDDIKSDEDFVEYVDDREGAGRALPWSALGIRDGVGRPVATV